MKRRPIFMIAVIGVLFGAYLLFHQLNFEYRAQEAEGKITARNEEMFTVQYNVGGHNYDIKESVPSTKGVGLTSHQDFQVGEAVKVIYDPEDPSRGQWKSSRNSAFAAIIIIMCGLFAFTILYPQVLASRFKLPFFRN